MTPAAESAEWYAKEVTWMVVGVVATLAVGLLTAWAAMNASLRRCRTTYEVVSNSLLPSDPSANVSVSHQGVRLGAPRAVTIYLRNAGRRDITSDQFHGGRPIAFDFGRAVLELPSVQSSASSYPIDVELEGNAFLVKPSFVRRKKGAAVTVLLDGGFATDDLAVRHVMVNGRVDPVDNLRNGAVEQLKAVALFIGATVAGLLALVTFVSSFTDRF
ncbi:hypothetical protein [Streptomyces thermolilacinus]|uniref:hypothetical protein n=1 Tax=Streptomyces thermolilacinus TaxID=285540 RepID=UPI0033F9AEB4